LYVPADQVLDTASRDAISYDAPGARYTHRDGRCTLEVLIEDYQLTGDAALMRLARIVHAADIDTELDTDPAGPGLLAIGIGGPDVEADDHRCWNGPVSCTTLFMPGASVRYQPQHERDVRIRRPAGRHRPAGRAAHGGGSDHGSQVGRHAVPGRKPGFMETVITGDPEVRASLAGWMRVRGSRAARADLVP
jgi:hypothetical protein